MVTPIRPHKCVFEYNDTTCTALNVKNCNKCSFYKSSRKFYRDKDGYINIIPPGYTVTTNNSKRRA